MREPMRSLHRGSSLGDATAERMADNVGAIGNRSGRGPYLASAPQRLRTSQAGTKQLLAKGGVTRARAAHA